MKSWLAAIGLGLTLALSPPNANPASAQESEPSEDPGSLALDGIARMMEALEALVDSIPQYEMPEINEHGDIIIRRKRDADPEPGDGGMDELDQTQT